MVDSKEVEQSGRLFMLIGAVWFVIIFVFVPIMLMLAIMLGWVLWSIGLILAFYAGGD